MLDVSRPLTVNKVKSYYKTEYSAASNSYFSQGNTITGEWHGKLMHELGLSGEVTEEAFDRLAEGQHSVTGEQLIRHRDTVKTKSGKELGHRAGWDLTFNAPKTVSLTALVGDDEAVLQAHRKAVREALNALEEYIQARGGGNKQSETTGKWISALFEHNTARPKDGYPAPHLHTHVIVFNMTEDRNGQARSLQPYEFFRAQSMATAIYQNQLEHELRMLGYQIERGKNHAPDIKGYSQEYLQAESQRSAEIYAEMEAKGLTGRESQKNIAHHNREEKLKITPEELRTLHKQQAEKYGNQPDAVVSAALNRKWIDISPEKIEETARLAVEHARARLSERSSVFDHFEVVRDALRHAKGRARLEHIELELERQKQLGNFVAVDHIRQAAPKYRYTTPELIRAETESIGLMKIGQDSQAPAVKVSDQELALRFPLLNEDQRALAHGALGTRDQVLGIQGKAGTGKTTALEVIRLLAEESGYKTHGLGPTSRATKGLSEAGIDSETLQMYLIRGKDSVEDMRRCLYFVDEASLASTIQMRDFLVTLGPQDRVLLVGDTKQHQSVEAGRILEELQGAGMRTISLSKIIRQKDEGLRKVVEEFSEGRTTEGVELLISQNRVHENTNRSDRFACLAKTYAEQPEGTLVISPDNRSRLALNEAIREEMQRVGKLGEDVYAFYALRTRQDVTRVECGYSGTYRENDVIRYLKGSEALGIEPKSYATVIKSDEDSNMISVQREDGKLVTYDPGKLRGVTIYEPELRSLAIGDRIQFTAPWRDKTISNRDTGTITYLDESGNIRVSIDDSSRTIGWNLNQNKHIDHAYVMTSHSAQGATVDRVLIHIDTEDSRIRSLINDTLAYVAASRPRYDAQIFTDNAENLSKALSRKQQNATALAPEEYSFSF
jgi:conjugative relaxase-like TrwC/TraI family protein